MKKHFTTILALLLVAGVAGPSPASAKGPEKPRLVLLIAVDQMRFDYLTRFSDDFSAGLRTLLDEGAVYTNAHLGHYPSVTAVGHSTMLSGAPPAQSGIVGNDWYDRREKRNVTSVEDPDTRLVGRRDGQARTGSSPHRLMVSTLGDELKMARPGTRVVGLSLKDRAAILMAGRGADLALWWDTATGDFVTSTWYASALPDWAARFNAGGSADAWAGREWRALGSDGGEGELFATMPTETGGRYYNAVYGSPLGNDLLEAMAEAALAGEELGQRDVTDVLAVSFSSNDAVGHSFGPRSPQVEDITRRTDLAIGRLLDAVDRGVGLGRTIVVLTADHGVAPVPEDALAMKLPAGRLARETLEDAATGALEAAYGPGAWLEGRAGSDLYLNQDLVRERGLDLGAVERTAARSVEALPSVWRAYTRSQILEGDLPPDPWSHRVLVSFHRARSGDVAVLLEPYWMSSATGTTHGTPYSYDTHIPLVIMGPGITPGSHARPVLLNDLAPTLATLLGVETPSGSSGRALEEVVAR